jgi:hypothetical protein
MPIKWLEDAHQLEVKYPTICVSTYRLQAKLKVSHPSHEAADEGNQHGFQKRLLPVLP